MAPGTTTSVQPITQPHKTDQSDSGCSLFDYTHFCLCLSFLFRLFPVPESTTTGNAGGVDFTAIGGKRQRHRSAPIGAGGTGCKAPGFKKPNKIGAGDIFENNHPPPCLSNRLFSEANF